jgi:hypothetical protein
MNDIENAVAAQVDGLIAEDQAKVKIPADDGEEVVSEQDEEVSDTADDGDADGNVDKEMKTIKKALNKKNRYIDNLRARNRTLEAEMQKLRASPNGSDKKPPSMDQFESVLDYVKAENSYELDKRFSEQQSQQQLSLLEQQQAAIRQQQTQAMAQDFAELSSVSSEAKSVLEQAMPLVGQMPAHLDSLFFEIDNAAAAIYALAKEGRLQDVYYMHPHIAAAEIVQAQQRGLQYMANATRQVPQKQPPKPLDGLKGRVRTSRDYKDMSPDEIVKTFIK